MTDYVGSTVVFLLEKTGSIFGKFYGKMSAQEQRNVFGRYLGKGTIIIDGSAETICNRVKVCFGMDYDDRNVTKFSQLIGD